MARTVPEYIGKEKDWPRHSRAEARGALAEARAQGWVFKSGSGHSFGRLRCHRPEDPRVDDACKVPIYSTSGSADGSATAEVIRAALRKCPHRLGALLVDRPSTPALEEARLVRVERLLAAALGLCVAARAARSAHASTEEAVRAWEEGRPEEAAIYEEYVLAREGEAAKEQARAHSTAAAANAADPWPPERGASDLMDQATADLEELARYLRQGGDDPKGELTEGHAQLAERLRDLGFILRP
jgi:hypothetical protein